MKKVLLSAGLCMLVTLSFAQKKAVKDAKGALNSKSYSEARELIKPALTDPETQNDPETWKIAGDIENKQFEAENMKQMLQQQPDEKTMYTALYATVDPYVKADELGQLPDEKGKIKNKYRKDIVAILKANHPHFINGGVYYNNLKEYSKAADFFQKYWEIPSLAVFSDEKEKINTNDSTFQTIKYYSVICAIQASQSDEALKEKETLRAIELLNKLISEPYVPNSTYKEHEAYELLASEYESVGDTVKFIETLESGAAKFPDNKYFVPNLINQYIKRGERDKALAYLDKAIADSPSSACDMYSVKAALYAEKQDFATADATYSEALTKDAKCERALEGLAVSYILQAQNLKEQAGNTTVAKDRAELDDKAKELYTKAVPLLEGYKESLLARKADESELKAMYVKLQNVYYNLDINDKYEEASKELEKYKY